MKAICLSLGICMIPLAALADCRQEPFEAFFPDFARDIALQEALTPERLMLSQIDHDATPEPTPVEREVTREALEWPLVPNLTPFERAGGSVRYEVQGDAHSVTLTGDSGYLMTLVFTQNPCWHLQKIQDDSM